MRKKMAKILNFFVLFILAVALTGVNVCRFYCTPCGHEYILVNTFPQPGKCYCDVCRQGDCTAIDKCCKNKSVEGCCACHKKQAHSHSACDHIFYKITDVFQTEPVLDIHFVAVLPEDTEFQVLHFDILTVFMPDHRNIVSSKAPPLEWLCTYLC
ncbi:hypothetical protein [Culturomica massiliensis]|uniref:hypothetical protein n=1 Tax=Culturomica massiliensis TaxID=1841857 RepID=UPI0026702C19|nr:hypothetical protein [Culturomica massiliensis]